MTAHSDTTPEDTDDGFASLAEFQRAHTALTADFDKDGLSDAASGAKVADPEKKLKILTGDRPSRIADLVRRGVATGAALDDKDERAAAQALINFWTGRLSSAAREAERVAAKQQAAGESPAPVPDVADLGDTLLADFNPKTIGKAWAAADEWLKQLMPGDGTAVRDWLAKLMPGGVVTVRDWLANVASGDGATVRRLLLRLVRLRPNEPGFEAVPTSRAALRHADLSAGMANEGSGEGPKNPSLLSADELIKGLAATGVIRVTAGETPEADQIALRSAMLLDEWPTLRSILDGRKAFREQVEQWDRRTAAPKMSALNRFQRAARKTASGVVDALVWVGDRAAGLWASLRRTVGLPPPANASLLAGRALEEVRTYHDWNEAERRFVLKSRYREVEGHRQSRVLAAVFALLVCVAATGWVLAVVSNREALHQQQQAANERQAAAEAQIALTVADAEVAKTRQMLHQREVRDMQTAEVSISRLTLALIVMTEDEGLAHAAKKYLIIQTLGEALFWESEEGFRRGRSNWNTLKAALTAEDAPGSPWFNHFFDADDEDRSGFQKTIERITSGKPADREAVEGLRRVSVSLRRWIMEPPSLKARERIRSVFATIKPAVLVQLAEVTDRIANTAEQRPTARMRSYRNIFWRMYAGEVVLLEGLEGGAELGKATKKFADALREWEREWEDSPERRASPATIEKLKQARDAVHAECNRK